MYDWKEGDRIFPKWMREDEEYEKEIKSTKEDDVVLLPNSIYVLHITYPLSTTFIHQFVTTAHGMTRKELVKIVVTLYHKIYDEEDASVGATPNIPGMFNRQESKGPHGIWGHSLDDLILHSAEIDKDNVITLGIDS